MARGQESQGGNAAPAPTFNPLPADTLYPVQFIHGEFNVHFTDDDLPPLRPLDRERAEAEGYAELVGVDLLTKPWKTSIESQLATDLLKYATEWGVDSRRVNKTRMSLDALCRAIQGKRAEALQADAAHLTRMIGERGVLWVIASKPEGLDFLGETRAAQLDSVTVVTDEQRVWLGPVIRDRSGERGLFPDDYSVMPQAIYSTE